MKIKFWFWAVLMLSVAQTTTASEVTVKDGDSLEIGDRRIRLDGIDAPELTQICQNTRGEDYECGIDSLHYLENLVGQRDVDCKCLSQKDRYKREICECFADGISLNGAMVAAGQAIAYRDETYLKEQENAEKNKLGLWQGKYMRPAIYRILHKPEINTETVP